nr:cartilage acidic protein 1-like [Lytechinus pictus]
MTAIMLANLIRPSLRYVAGLVSVVLLKSTIHSSPSSVAMATNPSNPSKMPHRGVNNHYYAGHHHRYHHHPEYHEPGYAGVSSSSSGPWFESMREGFSDNSNPVQKNYGVAVTDVDNDGELEIIVAGFDGPNLVLKYNHETRRLENLAIDDPTSPYYQLRDQRGSAIGVCACDVDGDGREEIYFLNTNNAYSGRKQYMDKLFKWRNDRYEDVLSDTINSNVINQYAGRSVACIDRKGTGRYSIYLSNYANRWVSPPIGPCAMVEMDETQSDVSAGIIKIRNVASEVGVEGYTGGRGVAVGPILNDEGRSDIFCDNEGGPNFLYKNDGRGNFEEVAASSRISDARENGRGVALADFNGDGKLDIVYGSWNGHHRLYLQKTRGDRRWFQNVANASFEEASPIRTVIAADFDNDGILEVYFNNIAYHGPAPNRLYKIRPTGDWGVNIEEQTNLGDAAEVNGYGTGGAVTDLDGDGQLELILSHGESASQPLTLYHSRRATNHRWLRVMPLTQNNAPARGAVVNVMTRNGNSHLRVIDGGSGYLCEMEPVAHFGFGPSDVPVTIEVKWPDTSTITREITVNEINSFIKIQHPVNSQSDTNQRDTSGSNRNDRPE